MYAINTDKLHLTTIAESVKKILIGASVTKGLGAGGYPDVGRKCAEASRDALDKMFSGADLVFLTAGMGGGTGTGSAPVLANVAKKAGAIVISIVTYPFALERARLDKADEGLEALKAESDTIIVIDNNRLVQIAGNLPVQQAFAVANELIATMIRGIVEIIAVPSLVNLDYADVKAVMTDGGVAAIGIGFSDTNNRVQEAVHGALANPLLDISYEGATGAIIHVEGGPDMTLDDVNKVGELVTQSMDEDANVIWGARINDALKGKISVLTIITGVKSPWILGKVDERHRVAESKRVRDFLDIEIVN